MADHPPTSASLVDALAYLYFFVAQRGDAAGLTPDERAHIHETLLRWVSFGNQAITGTEIDAAMTSVWKHASGLDGGLGGGQSLDALHSHARTVCAALPDLEHRKAVLYDMASVARADGTVSAGEREIVATVQRLFLQP